MSHDITRLDPSLHLAAARNALAQFERHRRGSPEWREAASSLLRSAKAIHHITAMDEDAADPLSLVGLPDIGFHPDVDRRGLGPVPRGLGRRNAPEACP